MAKETQIGKLAIDLQVKMEGLEKGLETAKKKLQEMEQQNEKVKNSNNSLDLSFIVTSASIVASLKKIKSAISDGVEKYNNYTNSMQALQKTATTTGNSINDVKNMMEDVNKLKLMDDSDVTSATKNLLTYGFSVEQTSDVLKVLQDAAVGNRQASYSLSEAVRVTTEGIRMENSVLSDAAGVQKNISKMYEEHAKSIGKTTDSLTQAEKVQAVYNGIMDEAAMFTGSASEMADGYQGTQAQLNASSLELSRTFGETMIPVMNEINTKVLSLTQWLNSLVAGNKESTAGTVAFVASLGVLSLGLAATAKLLKALKTAMTATEVGSIKLKLALGAIVTVSSLVVSKIAEQKVKDEELAETKKKLAEITERYNKIQKNTLDYSQENVDAVQQEVDEIENAVQKIKDLNTSGKESADWMREYLELMGIAKKYSDTGIYGDDLKKQLEQRKKYLKDAETYQKIKNATDLEAVKTQQKEAAQLKVNVQQMQDYLNVVKKGDKSTSEYQTAVEQLTKAYPEAANAEGIVIDAAQDFINAEKLKADQSWNTSQQTINNNIEVINSFIDLARQAENDAVKQAELARTIGISYEQIIPTLTGVLNALQLIGGYEPSKVPGTTKVSTPKISRSSGSSSYSNKKLDNYKKEIEYKKSLDKLSLQEEIKMYEKALKSYAKTTDEKRELRTKIYELNKEMAQKEKELLEQQTEDYENAMQKQKNAKGAAYDINEQTKDYNKIIQIHKNYLNQIMKDERLSLDERKEIYREELDIIRDYEQQKRDLRVEQIDSTVSQLTNAITKQLEEMQKKDKEMIDKNLKVIEEWKEARINAINEEYDARIEAINRELEALNKAEQQKTRDEEDAEYKKKKLRLEELVAFEHDATTKANYQKELDKLIEEYQKTLDARALEDKKEALNAQKELLQEEQENQVESIEKEAERQTEVYNKQLEELEKYYDEQIDMAQKTAENMLLNVQKNQDNILNLLKNYGDAYEITGQSLGEKLAQGINNGLASKIENIIAKIQDKIDAGIESQIAKMSSSAYKYNAGEGKTNVKSITTNVVQNNYIEQNPEMPSETYRKLNNVSQKLAEEFAGM